MADGKNKLVFRNDHSRVAMPPNLPKQSKKSAINLNKVKGSIAIALSQFHHLNIQQKISCGYAIALSIAVMGTTGGIIYSNYYQKQAELQLYRTSQEEVLLSELQYYVLETNNDQLQLIPGIEQASLLAEEEKELQENLLGMKNLFAELKLATQSHFNNLEEDVSDLEAFLANYQNNIDAYIQKTKSILNLIQTKPLNYHTIKTVRQTLIEFNQSDVARKFDNLSRELDNLVEVARQEKREAQLSFNQAVSMGNSIIIISLGFSIALAVLLAFYTSQAIAHPIKTVTKVAQQVTQEANFNLQVPITTKDEIGVLAAAFNNLIHRVGEDTKKLEIARQTLEKKVQERTDQLFNKNQELELAHLHLQELNQNLVAQTHELNQALQDLKKTESQLIQSEKMSSLGQMVAGVAHEINNPINFIYANIEYISNYTQDLLDLVNFYQQYSTNDHPDIQDKIEEIDLEFLRADLPKMLDSMKLGSERIRQIVLSLRNFSRLDEAEMKKVDIHEGIDNTLLILNHRLKPNIQVIKKYKKLPMVECYPAQLNQVFMNIISNAIDALSEQKEPSQKQIIISTETSNTNQIIVRIWDNGTGISDEIKGKIFDPFFTTKPIGKGTGLGLSVCYEIIEKHGGKIELNSELGKGTEFAIVFPIKR